MLDCGTHAPRVSAWDARKSGNQLRAGKPSGEGANAQRRSRQPPGKALGRWGNKTCPHRHGYNLRHIINASNAAVLRCLLLMGLCGARIFIASNMPLPNLTPLQEFGSGDLVQNF